jgi:hypothetical protein
MCPMPSGLADPYLKTVRAKEHLDDIRERLRVFRESDPCSFRREDDFENGLHIIRFKFKNVPDKIALVVGDFLYCLRSALDQLVWALALRKQVGTYPRGTQFPIFKEANRQKFESYTSGVPTEAIAIIESFQPYRGRDTAARESHLLWRLNLLCNIDKHRRIPVDASILDFRLPEFPERLIPQVQFDHDAEMIVAPLEFKRYMALDPQGSLDVTFGDPCEGIRCNLEGLEQIYEFVTNSVIPRFTRFF